MRILVSGPVNYDYSQCVVKELQSLGHTVLFYPMKEFYTSCSYIKRKAYKLGFKYLKDNYDYKWRKDLLTTCQEFMPDIIVFMNGMMLNVDLLRNLRNYRKILWLWDALERDGVYNYALIPYFDKIAVFEHNDIDKVKKHNKNVIYLPLGYSEAYAQTCVSTRDIDISFIGMPDAKRLVLLEKIAEKAFNNGWRMYVGGIWYDERWPWKKRRFFKRFPFLAKYIHNKILTAQQSAEIYARSKICLNINTVEHSSINPRTFEILAAGAMMLYDTEKLVGNPFTPARDYEEFYSEKDLLDKIQHYMGNKKEREKIAIHGKKANKDNSLGNRVIDLLNSV